MKKLILALLALVVLCAWSGCPRPSPTPPGPAPLVDGSAPVVVIPDAAPPLLDAAPPPAPTPTNTADAAPPVPMTPVGAACFNLAALGCPEGKDPQCVAVTQHALDSRLTKVPLACLTTAKTAAAARTCGFVSCPTK